MTTFRLTSDGDLDLSTNNIVLIDGDEALIQKLKARLQFFRGEWFLDRNIGFPYWTDVFLKAPDLTVVRSLYRQTILGCPGIDSLNSLELDYIAAERRLDVSFSAVKSEGGILEFEEEFILL
jgi:hypothetical protein